MPTLGGLHAHDSAEVKEVVVVDWVVVEDGVVSGGAVP